LAAAPNDSKAAAAACDLFAPADLATLGWLEGVLLTKSGAAPFTAKIGDVPHQRSCNRERHCAADARLRR
jgi:hypothetical protein